MSKSSIREMKHQIKLNQWKTVIMECQQSGDIVEKWCEDHGIGVKSYYYWLKKVREATLNTVPDTSMSNDTDPVSSVTADVIAEHVAPVAIKQLIVEEPNYNLGNIVIHLPYGKVEINGFMPEESIRQAISALKEESLVFM